MSTEPHAEFFCVHRQDCILKGILADKLFGQFMTFSIALGLLLSPILALGSTEYWADDLLHCKNRAKWRSHYLSLSPKERIVGVFLWWEKAGIKGRDIQIQYRLSAKNNLSLLQKYWEGKKNLLEKSQRFPKSPSATIIHRIASALWTRLECINPPAGHFRKLLSVIVSFIWDYYTGCLKVCSVEGSRGSNLSSSVHPKILNWRRKSKPLCIMHYS